MKAVTPQTVVAGALMKVQGEFLDAAHVSKVFLTDGKLDIELQIVKQQAAEVELKAPKDLKAGSFFLMVQTTGSDGMLIEQPVKVKVAAPEKTS